MGETMIKGRRRGDIVPFSSITTTGEIIQFSEIHGIPVPYSNSVHNTRNLSLYSSLIPLVYVTLPVNTETMINTNPDSAYETFVRLFFGKKDINKEEWNKTYKDKFYKHPMRDLIWRGFCNRAGDGKENIINGVHEFIKKHLSFDRSIDLSNIRDRTYSRKDEVTASFRIAFWSPWRVNKFNFRSYSGYVSPYSIWIKGEREYNPHIIAVIRAEDWAYQRLYMLLHNTVDISKVFILVDNRVDGIFPFNAFKGYYKEQLEPELKKLSCPVFKVPHEYIMQNCFIQQFQIQEKNIFKRKQAVEHLIDGFYGKYGEKPKEEIKVTQQEAEMWAASVIQENPQVTSSFNLESLEELIQELYAVRYGAREQTRVSSARQRHTMVDRPGIWEQMNNPNRYAISIDPYQGNSNGNIVSYVIHNEAAGDMSGPNGELPTESDTAHLPS